MQSFEFPRSCAECNGRVADVGDELVCQQCGMVKPKEVMEEGSVGVGPVMSVPLGSYLGSVEMTPKERHSKGLSSNSTYAYIKKISDFAGKEDGTAYACEKLIDRAKEKLSLPEVVATQAIAIARKILSSKGDRKGVTAGAVSAYSLIAACKIEGVTSVSVRDVVKMHAALGRRVSSSALIQISLISPIKAGARTPEEYLSRVLAKLTFNPRLAEKLAQEGVSPSAYSKALREVAQVLLNRVDEGLKAGHRPSTIAATSVYAAEAVMARWEGRKRRVTQRDLAECGDAAEYTVREQYRQIFAPAVQQFNPEQRQTISLPSKR